MFKIQKEYLLLLYPLPPFGRGRTKVGWAF